MAKKIQVNKAFVEKYLEATGYPIQGAFTAKEELQKFYKFCTDEQLAEWCEQYELTYTPNDSAPINRMRMCMAILYSHFPKAPSAKKKSKYSEYTLEDLMSLALEKDVVFEATDDDRIMRMRAIMALRAAGHLS